MRRNFDYRSSSSYRSQTSYRPSRSYGCMGFLFDCLMVVITGGLWLIWIFVREMRRQ